MMFLQMMIQQGQFSFVQHWITHLYAYQEMLEKEGNLILQFLLQMTDTLVCLYGVQPNADALPHFFPIIYPFLQEPRDAEEYAKIADKLTAWRARFKGNYELMKDMFKSIQTELDDGKMTPPRMQELVNATFQS